MKRFLSLWLMLALTVGAFAQRKALVVASPNFGKEHFASSLNDAEMASEALSALDFEVEYLQEPDAAGFLRALQEFSSSLDTGMVAVFYYSGFSESAGGINYLLPSAGNAGAKEAKISVDEVLSAMNKATESFAFLEIRQSKVPFPKSLCKKQNAIARAPALNENQALAISQSPGKRLAAKDNEYSIFSYMLFKNMTSEMMDFEDLMRASHKDVKALAKNKQTPYWQSNLDAPFSFFHPEQTLKFRYRLPLFRGLEGGGSYNF